MIEGLYVPGLGDHNARGEDRAMAMWRRRGVNLHYAPIFWREGDSFMPKLQNLQDQIDEMFDSNGPLALVGSSAGASAILNAAANRPGKVSSIVTVCGKIYHPETLPPADFINNPAFQESLEMLPHSLDILEETHRDRTLCIAPMWDGRVPVQDALIDWAQPHRILTIGHVVSIAAAVTIMNGPACDFILNT
jgi:pimeloyl-ACP methyl ester carboxylesterase